MTFLPRSLVLVQPDTCGNSLPHHLALLHVVAACILFSLLIVYICETFLALEADLIKLQP